MDDKWRKKHGFVNVWVKSTDFGGVMVYEKEEEELKTI